MASTQKYINHLLQSTGITPACSEEERTAADILADIFRMHGFAPEVQEFSATHGVKNAQAIVGILVFLGTVLTFAGGAVRVVGFLIALAGAAFYLMERNGRPVLSNIGSGGLSQNVIAYHKASGPMASPRNRPVVVVAHYDSPRVDLLSQMPFAPYRPLLAKVLPVAMVAPAAISLVRIFPIPGPAKVFLWIVALLLALVALFNAVAIIANRFVLPYTTGSVCNKSSVAALLGVMDAVAPYRGENEFPDDIPYADFMKEQADFAASIAPEQDAYPAEGYEGEEGYAEEGGEDFDAPSMQADQETAFDEQLGQGEAYIDGDPYASQQAEDEAASAYQQVEDEAAVGAAEERGAVEAVAAEAESVETVEEDYEPVIVNAEGNFRYGEDVIRELGMVGDACKIVYEDGALPVQPVPSAAVASVPAPVAPAVETTPRAAVSVDLPLAVAVQPVSTPAVTEAVVDAPVPVSEPVLEPELEDEVEVVAEPVFEDESLLAPEDASADENAPLAADEPADGLFDGVQEEPLVPSVEGEDGPLEGETSVFAPLTDEDLIDAGMVDVDSNLSEMVDGAAQGEYLDAEIVENDSEDIEDDLFVPAAVAELGEQPLEIVAEIANEYEAADAEFLDVIVLEVPEITEAFEDDGPVDDSEQDGSDNDESGDGVSAGETTEMDPIEIDAEEGELADSEQEDATDPESAADVEGEITEEPLAESEADPEVDPEADPAGDDPAPAEPLDPNAKGGTMAMPVVTAERTRPIETVDSLMAQIDASVPAPKAPARAPRLIDVPQMNGTQQAKSATQPNARVIRQIPPVVPDASALQQRVVNRGALFDIPDPSVTPDDPFAAASPSTTVTGPSRNGFTVVSSNTAARLEVPDPTQAAPAKEAPAPAPVEEPIQTISAPAAQEKPKRGLGRLFGKKKKKQESMSEWLGVDDDFDAKRSGAEIGSWDNFDSDDDWKGGATGSEELTEEELRDAIASMGDDELLGHDIWFVATGASECDNAGAKAFLEEHRSKLRGVFLINLECVGAGRLAVLSTEGENRVLKGDKRIMRLVQRVSGDFHNEFGAVDMPYLNTDAYAAMNMSLRSLTIAGVDATSLACSHNEEDQPFNVDERNIQLVTDVVTEVIRRS